ncbi:hypothetical protein LJK88_49865 [Paenibacillus sp. P26]|nr:hypothetical protein LJK88_49865 [Paenibacillus sp. P26]
MFGGIAGAFGETAPEGVQIKEFSLLDTGSDVVGSADFTPEGNKDGHFKLRLSLTQKTSIKSVVLRSTDDYGKDNYHGVWRTNRVTTGWLLGIVQDKLVTTPSGTAHESIIVNPGFRKDVNEPVGNSMAISPLICMQATTARSKRRSLMCWKSRHRKERSFPNQLNIKSP